MTTGEGGMLVTKKKFYYDKIVKLKSQGLNIYKKDNFYNHDIVGYNYRMTNICAAIGLAQLKKLIHSSLRKKIDLLYRKFLKSNKINFQKIDKNSSYWLTTILFNNANLKKSRKIFKKKKILKRDQFFKPMNQLKMYKLSNKNFKNSIDIFKRNFITLVPSTKR